MGLITIKTDITFLLFTTIILFGVGSYLLIFEYGTIPKVIENSEWFVGKPESMIERPFWEFNIGNGYMSNIEHMTIFLCLFLGMLRLIDLIKTIEYDKIVYKWAYFFEYLEEHQNF